MYLITDNVITIIKPNKIANNCCEILSLNTNVKSKKVISKGTKQNIKNIKPHRKKIDSSPFGLLAITVYKVDESIQAPRNDVKLVATTTTAATSVRTVAAATSTAASATWWV